MYIYRYKHLHLHGVCGFGCIHIYIYICSIATFTCPWCVWLWEHIYIYMCIYVSIMYAESGMDDRVHCKSKIGKPNPCTLEPSIHIF